jgi:hypothetical protein
MRGHPDCITQITTRRKHQTGQQRESARSGTIKEWRERNFRNIACAAVSKPLQPSQSTAAGRHAPDASDHNARSGNHGLGRRGPHRLVAANH